MLNKQNKQTNKQTNSLELKFLLGGKGANLAEMSAIGLAVPPGLTITTEVCQAFHKNGKQLPVGVWATVLNKLAVRAHDKYTHTYILAYTHTNTTHTYTN